VEQKVHDTAIDYIQQIRTREKQIVEELQNIYGPDCIQQLASKKELLAQVTSLSQGRLNQWTHWARAQDPRTFFLVEGHQLAVVK